MTTTLKDIAQLAGVSATTISRYFSAPEKLSKSTREKIEAVVNEHNFSPNMHTKSLVTQKSGLIGVVIPDVRNPFFSQLYYRLENILEPLGYTLILCNAKDSESQEEKYLRLLISRQVEGIILVPVDKQNVDLLIKRKINFVLVERIIESIQSNTVTSDHYEGAYMTVEHLIQSGHKNIAVLCGDTTLMPFHDRLEGYYDALKVAGILLKKEFVCESMVNIESAENAFMDLISKEKEITAVFSCNNLMSIGAINAIYKSNLKIPDDIVFAAFDELPGTEHLLPSITSVKQDTTKLAESAVQLLLNQISGKQLIPEHIQVPVTIKKGSTIK